MPDGTEFGAAATLSVEVDPRSLANARAEVEEELGGVTVGVGASGGPAAIADGSGGGMAALEGVGGELADQTDILEDIYDEIEGGIAGSASGGGPSAIVPTGGKGKNLLKYAGLGTVIGAATFANNSLYNSLDGDSENEINPLNPLGPVLDLAGEAYAPLFGGMGEPPDVSGAEPDDTANVGGTGVPARVEQGDVAAPQWVTSLTDTLDTFQGEQPTWLSDLVASLQPPGARGDASTEGRQNRPDRLQARPNDSAAAQSRDDVATGVRQGSQSATNRAKQTKQRPVNVTVNNEIQTDLSIRDINELQRLLRNPERVINDRLAGPMDFPQ